MKLQYVKNLFWYDGPMADLYIGNGFDLYVSALMSNETSGWIYFARKLDSSVSIEPGIGIVWPENFFQEKGVEYLIFDWQDCKEEKLPYLTYTALMVDARVATPEELEKYQ